MPRGKGTYGSQRGRPRKDAGESLMYQKRGPISVLLRRS